MPRYQENLTCNFDRLSNGRLFGDCGLRQVDDWLLFDTSYQQAILSTRIRYPIVILRHQISCGGECRIEGGGGLRGGEGWGEGEYLLWWGGDWTILIWKTKFGLYLPVPLLWHIISQPVWRQSRSGQCQATKILNYGISKAYQNWVSHHHSRSFSSHLA